MNVVKSSDNEKEDRLRGMMATYKQDLLHMAYVYLRDAALAEDAVQETFIKAYRAMDSFRGESGEKTWLTRIAINTCKDMRRAAWFRYVDRSVTLDDIPDAPLDERDSALMNEIIRLPRKQMEVVLLYYYQEIGEGEIAQMLGIAVSTVSTRLKRARESLRRALERGRQNES